MKIDIFSKKTIAEISDLLKRREISYTELILSVIEKIKSQEKKIGAYLTLTTDLALKEADELDKHGRVPNNFLFGIPISVKDTFTTKGVKTTAGSKILEEFIPPYDATSYKRLKTKGTILIGKTNMDEYAHGFTTEYSAFQSTRNPWNVSRVPGGSSGGSAASVTVGMSLLSLASENFGSIIQPSALCGVVGMKPTYGRASRYGIIAMVSSLECPGIIGRCVEDVALGIGAICGTDEYDMTTVNKQKENFYRNMDSKIQSKRIAVIKPIISNIDNHEIVCAIEKALHLFSTMGAVIEYIDWYDLSVDSIIYDILYRAEVASNLARYDGIRYGYRNLGKTTDLDKYYKLCRSRFGKHVKRQIITEPITLEDENKDIYSTALKIRRQNSSFIDSFFKKYDAIITPACTFVELEMGKTEDQKWRNENRHLGKINAAMICPTALYGYPAITFPIELSKSGMPIGINMFTARFNEQILFNLAYAFEENTELKFLIPKTL
jgi:aspartyl-tRNA(Asn)/glutamyl-tRNA(Gln) amidotransferase subunit A